MPLEDVAAWLLIFQPKPVRLVFHIFDLQEEVLSLRFGDASDSVPHEQVHADQRQRQDRDQDHRQVLRSDAAVTDAVSLTDVDEDGKHQIQMERFDCAEEGLLVDALVDFWVT